MIYNAPRPIQAPDFLGATISQANAANQRYGQKVAQQNANKQGLFSLGTTALQHYGPALAKALSASPTIGPSTLGTGANGLSAVANSSPEISSFLSSMGTGLSGSAGGVGTGLGSAGGTAGALTAAEAAGAAGTAAAGTDAAYLALLAAL